VAAAILLNPWVHTQAAEAKTFLWHYYPRRLVQMDFWRSLWRGEVAVGASLADFGAKVRKWLGARAPGTVDAAGEGSFVDRMRVMLPGADHTLSAAPDLQAFCSAVQEWLERPASRGAAARAT
jgi:hypothetical protein